MKRVIIPSEFMDMSDLMKSGEFKKYVENKNKNAKFIVGELEAEKAPAVAVSRFVGDGDVDSIEGFVNQFNEEKENKRLNADGDEVMILTEGMFDAMILGNPVCINGVWIAMSEKSEMAIVDKIEQKWMEELGLDGQEEKEK